MCRNRHRGRDEASRIGYLVAPTLSQTGSSESVIENRSRSRLAGMLCRRQFRRSKCRPMTNNETTNEKRNTSNRKREKEDEQKDQSGEKSQGGEIEEREKTQRGEEEEEEWTTAYLLGRIYASSFRGWGRRRSSCRSSCPCSSSASTCFA